MTKEQIHVHELENRLWAAVVQLRVLIFYIPALLTFVCLHTSLQKAKRVQFCQRLI